MTTTARSFGPALIGQTEKALNAILNRQLTGTGITEPQWVTLTLTMVSGGTIPRTELIHRVADATRVSQASVAERITELTAAGLLRDRNDGHDGDVRDGDGDGDVQATDKGQALWTQIRAEIEPITQRLWADLPAEDRAAAGRVLSIVLDRAGAMLADA